MSAGVLSLLLVVLGTLGVLVAVGRAATPAPDRPPLRTVRALDVGREARRGWRRLVELHERATPTRWT
ncbi:hypothetical protein GCM10027047_02730 [Rhodococcus aerolatus]